MHLLSIDIQRFITLIGKLSTAVLGCLNRKDLRNLSAIRKAYEQQKYMFDNNVRSCFKRIISIFQPHVRPIVRGKAGRKTEYGAKIGVSVVDGFTYITVNGRNMDCCLFLCQEFEEVLAGTSLSLF